ncbi:MAG: Rho termination factor N-terminal domain-containing protein, partial [Flavobacteriales bacterium]|nr:Rho termination factor N-terminal domain-containing protein [Flavobacteriales bacterium]
MFDITELSEKKLSELKEIAKKLNLKKADTLKKQDLIYKILDEQAADPAKAKAVVDEVKSAVPEAPKESTPPAVEDKAP